MLLILLSTFLRNCNPCSYKKVVWLFIHSFGLFLRRLFKFTIVLREAPDTRILCRSFMPKRHRQQQVKDLPKVPMWLQERDSNPRPFGRKATNLPMSHPAHNTYTSLHSPLFSYPMF